MEKKQASGLKKIVQNLAGIFVVATFGIGSIYGHYNIKRLYKPQTRNIITADPNASDPNDTYIDTPNGRACLQIDGKPIEEYFKRRN